MGKLSGAAGQRRWQAGIEHPNQPADSSPSELMGSADLVTGLHLGREKLVCIHVPLYPIPSKHMSAAITRDVCFW